MDVVRDDIKNLVTKELQAANEKFPQFRSLHEGTAVMLEEIEELREEVRQINGYYETLWDCVRGDEYGAGDAAESIKFHAIRAAVEAVQVAAMAEKFLYALEHDGEADERLRGKWQWTGIANVDYKCSVCDRTERRKTNYCPNCGADMRSEKMPTEEEIKEAYETIKEYAKNKESW